MARVLPFAAYRPNADVVSEVAALPYDVYKRAEAKSFVDEHPRSFLAIDRPETQFPDDFDMYSEPVYQKAAELLETAMQDGTYIHDEKPDYYDHSCRLDCFRFHRLHNSQSNSTERENGRNA